MQSTLAHCRIGVSRRCNWSCGRWLSGKFGGCNRCILSLSAGIWICCVRCHIVEQLIDIQYIFTGCLYVITLTMRLTEIYRKLVQRCNGDCLMSYSLQRTAVTCVPMWFCIWRHALVVVDGRAPRWLTNPTKWGSPDSGANRQKPAKRRTSRPWLRLTPEGLRTTQISINVQITGIGRNSGKTRQRPRHAFVVRYQEAMIVKQQETGLMGIPPLLTEVEGEYPAVSQVTGGTPASSFARRGNSAKGESLRCIRLL